MLKTSAGTKPEDISILLPDPLLEFGEESDAAPAVVLRSDKLGQDEPELGKALMSELLQALLDFPSPPQVIILYHRAILLAMPDSPAAATLGQLAKKGTEVLLCRTSCEHLAADQKEIAGRQAGFAELVDRIRRAEKVMWF